MRILLLTTIFGVNLFNCYGQANKVISGDTTFWYKDQSEFADKLKLPKLMLSKDKFHFRLWTDRQVIDIWNTSGTVYNGMVVSCALGESKQFSKTVFIDSATAKHIYNLTQNVATVPTDALIKEWKQGFDGITYMVEISTPTKYEFKKYWTPTAQDSSLAEARIIQTFLKDLKTSLALYSKYNDFFATLKPGSYTNRGMIITTKWSKKQSRYYERTKLDREHLATISDTLNQYLSDTLTHIFKKDKNTDCDNNFLLKFSKNNRLLKISTKDDLGDKEDRNEFKQCRKRIIEAFHLIKVSFVHSKTSYHRILSLDGSNADVSSPHWYAPEL